MTTVIVIFAVGVFIFYYAIPVIKKYNTCEVLAPQLRSLSNKSESFSKKYGFDKGVDYNYNCYLKDLRFRYEHLKALAEIGEGEYSTEQLKYAFSELQRMWEESEKLEEPFWKAREGLKALTGYKYYTGVKQRGVPVEKLIYNE